VAADRVAATQTARMVACMAVALAAELLSTTKGMLVTVQFVFYGMETHHFLQPMLV
jgi:hypothetical protein